MQDLSIFIFAPKFCMRYLIPVIFIFLLSACYPDAKWGSSKISSLEQQLLNKAKSGTADSVEVMSLLQNYERFATDYPTDSMSAEYLFRAADFYRYLGRPLKSIQVYERISLQFPNHSKSPIAVFLQGFIYENEIGNISAARSQYHRFITKYPDHPLVKDVVISMQNLGKSPEELVAEFKAKEAQDSAQVVKK